MYCYFLKEVNIGLLSFIFVNPTPLFQHCSRDKYVLFLLVLLSLRYSFFNIKLLRLRKTMHMV